MHGKKEKIVMCEERCRFYMERRGMGELDDNEGFFSRLVKMHCTLGIWPRINFPNKKEIHTLQALERGPEGATCGGVVAWLMPH